MKKREFVYATFRKTDICSGKCDSAACQILSMGHHGVATLKEFDNMLKRIPGSGSGSADVQGKRYSVANVRKAVQAADCANYVFFGNPDWKKPDTSDIEFKIATGHKPSGVVGYDIVIFKAILNLLGPTGDFLFYKGFTDKESGGGMVQTVCFSVNIKGGLVTYWDVSTHYPGVEGRAVKKTTANKAANKATKEVVAKKDTKKTVTKGKAK